MLVVVPVTGNDGIEVEVSEHFGHAPFFAFAKIEDGKINVEFVKNPFEGQHSVGNVPSLLVKQKANVLIAGNLGQRAYEILTENGIEVYPYASGTLKEVLDAFMAGKLNKEYEGDLHEKHFHMN